MARRKRKDKTQRRHAVKRFHQRCGVALTPELHEQIIQSIRDANMKKGTAKFIERQSLRVSVWEVDIAGERRRVVYDSNRKQLVTVLPDEDAIDLRPWAAT